MTKTQIQLAFWMATLAACPAAAQQAGLVGDYYNGENFEEKKMTRTDAQINFVWDWTAPAQGMDPEHFSIRWRGQIKSPETGKFLFTSKVDDGIRVRIGGKLVINAWGLHDSEDFSGHATLEAGQLYDIEVEYFNGMREGEIQLLWQLPSKTPTFGGLLGHNYEVIGSQFFFKKPRVAPTQAPTTTDPVPTPVVQKKKPVQQRTEPPKTQPPTQPKPKPVAKPVVKPTVVPADTLERYIPKNVLFEKGKSIILPESYAELDNLAGFLKRNTKLKVSIEGHTDNIGDATKNLALSEERAQKVREYLSNKSIDVQRISAKGYGGTRPLVQSKTAAGTAKNRRVEFILSY